MNLKKIILFSLVFLISLMSVNATDLTFGNAHNNGNVIGYQTTNSHKFAQSFVGNNEFLHNISFRYGYGGSPTDQINITIQTDSVGDPSGTILSYAYFDATDIITAWSSTEIKTITLVSDLNITSGTTYWIVLERTGSLSTVDWLAVPQEAGDPYSNGCWKEYNTGAWLACTTYDVYGKIQTSSSPIIPVIPPISLIIDDINLINNTITNNIYLDVALNISNISTNNLINTTLYLNNGSSYQIGANTQNVSYTLNNISEGYFDIWTYSYNNETNVTSSNYTYLFDFTPPSIEFLNVSERTEAQLNFTEVFNVTDALSGLASCSITLTYLENVTNASQHDQLINCTDTTNLTASGEYNAFIYALDNAGNVNTSSVNGTYNPLFYVYFENSTGGRVTNFTINGTQYNEVFSERVNGYAFGVVNFQFNKAGYETLDFQLNFTPTELINTTLNVEAPYITILIKELTNGSLVAPADFTLLYYNTDDDISKTYDITNNNTLVIRNLFDVNKSLTLNLVDQNGSIITNKKIVAPYTDTNISFYVATGETMKTRYFEVLSSSLSPITNDEVSLYVYLGSGEFVLHSQKDTNELGIVNFDIVTTKYIYTICNEYQDKQACLNQVIFDDIQTDYQIIHAQTLAGTTRNVLEYIEWSYSEVKTNSTSEMSFFFEDTQTNVDSFCLNVSRHDGTSLNHVGEFCSTNPGGVIVQTFSLSENQYLEYTFLYKIDSTSYILKKERSYFIGQAIEDLKALGILDLIFLIVFFAGIGTLLLFNSFEVYSIGILGLLLGIVSIQAYVNNEYVNVLLWGILALKTGFVYYVRGD